MKKNAQIKHTVVWPYFKCIYAIEKKHYDRKKSVYFYQCPRCHKRSDMLYIHENGAHKDFVAHALSCHRINFEVSEYSNSMFKWSCNVCTYYSVTIPSFDLAVRAALEHSILRCDT